MSKAGDMMTAGQRINARAFVIEENLSAMDTLRAEYDAIPSAWWKGRTLRQIRTLRIWRALHDVNYVLAARNSSDGGGVEWEEFRL